MAQQEVELILARKLAEGPAAPALLVDDRGDTLYFNEPAEGIFGRRFDEVDVLPFETRTGILAPLRADGQPLPPQELPGMRAMREHRPAHGDFHVHGLDGVLRPIEATAIPIESAHGRMLGAIIWLWPQDEASSGAVRPAR